jgi:hypothetical protein
VCRAASPFLDEIDAHAHASHGLDLMGVRTPQESTS